MACCWLGRVGGSHCLVGLVMNDSTEKLEYTKQKHVEGKGTNRERSWSSITCSLGLFLFGIYVGIGRIKSFWT